MSAQHPEPPWLAALREACQHESQAVVGARIGYSPAVVNQVLRRRYPGNEENVRERVEGALLGRTVECPVLGDIGRHVCLEHQRREFGATNPVRVSLYNACRAGCPHSRLPVGPGGRS